MLCDANPPRHRACDYRQPGTANRTGFGPRESHAASSTRQRRRYNTAEQTACFRTGQASSHRGYSTVQNAGTAECSTQQRGPYAASSTRQRAQQRLGSWRRHASGGIHTAHSRGACVAVAVPRVICALACACDGCETNTRTNTRTHTGRFAEQPA